jgi:hypothetical protein
MSRFRFFVFTNRDPRFDFRRPLVEALRRRYETYYIWLKPQPVISGPSEHDPVVEVSIKELVWLFVRYRYRDKVNIYFNSTENFPLLTAFIRVIAVPGIWCLDLHDDLLYHHTGFKRFEIAVAVAIMRLVSDVAVHASPLLAELFPNSKHLGNASHLVPLQRDAMSESRVLVISSFDPRIDFDFLSAVAEACPHTQFHLYGWTAPIDAASRENLRIICERNTNIHYHGPYALDDLPTILRDFRVCLAPYRIDIRQTRYIDPLRFYSCLNSGMEVISTDIPQARYMMKWIHIVHDPVQCAETLRAIQVGKLTKLEGYRPITWEQRVDRLIRILNESPRTMRLDANLPSRTAAAEACVMTRRWTDLRPTSSAQGDDERLRLLK